MYYEDWGSHRCAFRNVCTEHEGGEESHVGCGLQGVLHRVMVKSHGGHQCLWCDMQQQQWHVEGGGGGRAAHNGAVARDGVVACDGAEGKR